MKMRRPEPEDMDFSSSSEEEELDSDEALQEAFASGKLKPGLVILSNSDKGSSAPSGPINDVPLLKMHLEKIKLPNKFGWVERLDIVNDVAPLAPEIALQLDEHKGKRSREISQINTQKKKKGAPSPNLKSVDEDVVHNDFVRETGFYRQAQEAVLKCLPKLAELGIPTKRPEDYFAEMAKSDTHMQKVAQVLLKKQTAAEKAEKNRKLRDQKKFSKQTQIQVMQERQKAKKEMIESVKKYRKGQKGGSLDMLEDKKQKRGGVGKDKGAGDKRINRKRQHKNDKYGYGGKKKGQKWNTRDSLDSFEDGKSSGRGKGKGQGRKPMMGGKGGGGGGGGNKRPGKTSRQKMKARK